MRKSSFVCFPTALLMAAAIHSVAYAQLTGQISGTITDASGGVVPTAGITVINELTGIYTVPLLQPGMYQVNVRAESFRTLTREGIRLEVAQTAALDFTLEAGATSESVTVQETTASSSPAPTP